jgi:hypothetical protein
MVNVLFFGLVNGERETLMKLDNPVKSQNPNPKSQNPATSFGIWSLSFGIWVLGFGVMAAHHGTNISYDRTKPVTLTGTVTEFRLANPHPQLYVDVKDDSGKVTNWGCEVAANPYQLMLSGWTRQRSVNALKPGTTVTVTVAPSRAGTPVGVVLKIVNAQGEELLATAGANQ